jgi:hypothetical protein
VRDTREKARRKAKSKLIPALFPGGRYSETWNRNFALCGCVDGEEVVCHFVLLADQLAQVDIGLLSGFTSPTSLFIPLGNLNRIYWNE